MAHWYWVSHGNNGLLMGKITIFRHSAMCAHTLLEEHTGQATFLQYLL